ncbi:hypothetical protein IWQ60_007176 [Tieghemiomyces parasiticus]|uniref:Multidrug resistance-associated protein 1 n=1 Tax=Tieghemiomyces parasiticus TaxID=78921 RepID=A0A9W8A413_9FUNG|nr:hypothetical protein IWQ60_007176 [Tieghemiomyces parasiticus]
MTRHYYAKQALLLASIGISAYETWIAARLTGTYAATVPALGFLAQTLALGFALFLSHLEHTRSRIASGTLLLFQLALLMYSAVRLRTWHLIKMPQGYAALFNAAVISFVALAASFVAELYPKPRSDYLLPTEDMDHNSPEEEANIFSRISFSWMSPMLSLGYQRVLTQDDMVDLPRDTQTATVSDNFQDRWQRELARDRPSLARACVLTFGAPFALAAFFKAGQDLLAFAQPQLLRRLLNFVQDYYSDAPQPVANGYFIALTMFATALLQTALLHQYFQICTMVGLRVRAGLVTAIYQKSLRLSNAARQKFTVGEIVNHMSVDAQRLSDMTTYLHMAWSGLFQIALCLYYLYQALGWSAFAGVGVMVVAIPWNGYIATSMRSLQKKQMANKDTRIKLMDELLNGMKVIKLYAWEGAFLDRVREVRNNRELATLKDFGRLFALNSFTMTITPFLVSLATFSVYAVFDNHSRGPLTADLIFVSLTLLNLLRFPLMMLPMIMATLVEAGVAVGRIFGFLTSEELDTNAVERTDYVHRTQLYRSGDGAAEPTGEHLPLVEVTDGTFTWLDNDDTPTLRDINLKAHAGELVSVVGRVGSGKSSLISALLGDMRRIAGKVTVRGHVAYVSQQPWIMNATLRENILFGHRYDPTFYQKTIEVCALQQDIDMLSAGDLTEIGEKGINLSGGQKARVSLARAVYARADVYLLDDPLSAVDAHVGRHIFEHALGPHGLLRTRARILVTHAVQFLSKADRIIMLREGQVDEQGSFRELMRQKTALYRLIREFTVEEDPSAGGVGISGSVTDLTATPEESGSSRVPSPRLSPTIDPFGKSPSHSIYRDDTPVATDDVEAVEQAGECEEASKLTKCAPPPRPVMRRASLASVGEINRRKLQTTQNADLMTTETSARGQVSWDVYLAYLRSCSPQAVFLYLSMLVASKVLAVCGNLWLKHWSNVNEQTPADEVDNGLYLGVYGMIGLFSAACSLAMSLVVWLLCAIRAARTTHESMLKHIVRAPMSFFDTTPLGRILNRFSKDQYTIDETLPRSFTGYLAVLTSLVMVVAVIATSTPIFMTMFVPLSVVYLWIQRYYLATSRELKRLDSTTRSPIYAHFQESLGGVSTIRAYEQTGRFVAENEFRLELNQRAYYPYLALNRWLAVRLELMGAIIILGASLFSVITLVYLGGIDVGLVGLSMTYSLDITQTLNWCIRQSVEVETNIVSMERINEYSELASEAPEIIEDHRPEPTWPQRGEVIFDRYATRYRPGLDLVLRGISFTVKPREKVGIVGRTGAGKSSLTLALFRLIEAAEGRIVIDGEDISQLGLFDLRSRLSIIPQDPVLFTGTLRENLDPFGTYTDDAELWRVLENAHLKDYVTSLEDGLEYRVHQGGENFSVGQRQLICLARALLRRASVLVLDEATAAIDVETDKIIQETIRREFSHCTILTIAHRINTVLDNDRIIVMEAGKIVEFDTPANLLADKQSVFSSLASEP